MRYEEPTMEIIILDTTDIQTLSSGGTIDEGTIPGTDPENP